jgi:putative ABC transport system permease protein
MIWLKNYFKVTIRNLFRNKGYTAINIGGLTVALTCCLLILSYDFYELSYDRYNKNADKIYRVEIDNWAASPIAIGPYLKETFSGVEQFARFVHVNQATIREGEKTFNESNFFFCDSTVFKMFSYKFILGDPSIALNSPNSLIITKRMALKYFGVENPVGKRLLVNSGKRYEFTITGEIENLPSQSHFKFDFIASLNSLRTDANIAKRQWEQSICYTYLLINNKTILPSIEKKLRKAILTHTGYPDTTSLNVYLRPLTAIHLYSNCEKEIEQQGNISYLYIFSSVALFILLLAAINFINLSTALALNRTKEVAVRKTLGAKRKNLILQFMGESFLISFVSLLLAIVIVEAISSQFNSLSGADISNFINNSFLIFFIIVLCIVVAFVAGSYPAIYISSFGITKIFKSGVKAESRSSFPILLRKGLIIFQFAISVILLIGVQVISSQLDFIQKKNLEWIPNRFL